MIVNFFWLNFAPKLLHFLAQRQQPRVAIEVTVGLPRRAIGKALHLFLGKGVADHHVLLQHLVGTLGCHRAALQLRIEERPCRA
jgi:hypothetical protein